MGFAKSEAEIAERTARFIKAELKRANVTYDELAERLKEHGLSETRNSITAKLQTGHVPGHVPLGRDCSARIGRRQPRGRVMRFAIFLLAMIPISAVSMAVNAQQRPTHKPTPSPTRFCYSHHPHVPRKLTATTEQRPELSEQPSSAEQHGTKNNPAIVKILPAEKTEEERAQEEADHNEKAAADLAGAHF